MRKQQEKTDRLSLIILAAFLVLSTSHFMCRFDASGYIEGLFEKAWAGQVQSEAQVQPAAAVVPAADALAAAPKVQTIARNPFMAPAAMLNKPTVHPGAVIGGGAPVYAAQPVLRGIINNGVKQLAIIEFNNTSNYYKDGQSFGDYTVAAIGIDSVDLSHPRSTTLAALLAFSSTTVALAAPNVTLNVHDGEVRDVLTAISALSDASIVTDESVKGKITIALDNVPFNTAIKLITSAKGLAYRMVDGVILVSTQENLNKFNGSVNVFKLNYAKAEDVKNALNDILESEKKISIDPITNSILFSGSSTDEERVRSAIKAMDVATKQITLEAKIISINKEDSKNLGINWNWDKIPQNSEDSNNSSNNDDDEDFGGVVHFGASYEFRFNATLNALFANGKAKILATPRIITVPGKEASIFIGDHIPVLTEKIENGITVNTTEYVDAGIKLTYTPLVSEDDMITSAVHTEVSTPTLVSEIKNYKITSRTADTYVRMRNGETLIIGGLINEEEQKNIQKIPFLSNIPILGELFKNRSTTKNKTEVMMILTPHITEAGASPAIYDTQSLENEFKDFDDNRFLKDIKKSERSQAEAKIKAQQKELAKEMKELQKEFGDDKTKAPQSGSMRDRVNQILNEDK